MYYLKSLIVKRGERDRGREREGEREREREEKGEVVCGVEVSGIFQLPLML